MSIIIFFGFALIVLLVGLIYVSLTIRHHWKLSRDSQVTSVDKKS